MNTVKRFRIIAAIVIGLVVAFVAGGFFVLPYVPSQRAPVVQPQALSSSARPIWVTVNSASITTATNFAGVDWGSERYSAADVWYSIVQSDVNTLTLTLQVSPDNSTWVNHVATYAVVSNNVTDTNGYIAANVNMEYFRITATCGNTNAVTPTIKVYLR